MPNNKVKTANQLKKKSKGGGLSKGGLDKGKGEIHPGSRRAAQWGRVYLRAERIQGAQKDRRKVRNFKSDQISFFKWALASAIEDDEEEEEEMEQGERKEVSSDGGKVKPFKNIAEIALIIKEAYLPRHDSELDQLKSTRRPGRPKSSRQVELENLKDKEEQEFREGMEVPDLTDPETAKILIEEWTGDLQMANRIKFLLVRDDHLIAT